MTSGNYSGIPQGAAKSWKESVATSSALPSVGNTAGDVRVAIDTKIIYIWSGSAWVTVPSDATNLTGVVPIASGGTNASSASAALTSLGAEAVANKDTDGTMASNSDTKYPSQKAVRTYVAAAVTAGFLPQTHVEAATLKDDSLTTPPGSPVAEVVYIAASGAGGGWTQGHIYWHDGSSWVDGLNRAIQVGDRFGIMFHSGTGAAGSFAGKDKQIATVTNATPGSYAYTFETPAQGWLVNQTNPYASHAGDQYFYNGSSWIEYGEGSSFIPGNALDLTGNILDVLYDGSTITKNGSNQLTAGTIPVANGGTGGTTATTARQNIGAEPVFNGLEDPTKFSVSYDASTRKFTITYTGTAAYTVLGVRYTKTGSDLTTAHANTTGIWYCYYDSSGALTVSSSFWDLMTTAPIAAVYYTTSNAGGAAGAILYEERHPGETGMDSATHRWAHTSIGTRYVSGIAISGYTLNTNGSAALSWGTTSGIIADEDIRNSITAQADGGTYRICYKTGTSGSPVWNWVDSANSGIYDNGTNIYYNQLTGGSWQLTAVTSASFLNYWVIASNSVSSPQIIVVMGQTTYSSQALAQAATFASEVSDWSLFGDEGVLMYQMTYGRNVAYGAPGNSRLLSVNRLVAGILNAVIGTGSTAASSIITDTTNFDGLLSASDTTAQAALDTLDDASATANTANKLVKRDSNGLSGLNVMSDINLQTGTTYTLVAADNGKQVHFNNGSAITLTVPAGLGQGFSCSIVQLGAGQITLSTGAVTYNQIDGFTKSAGQYSVFTLYAHGANAFLAQGRMA